MSLEHSRGGGPMVGALTIHEFCAAFRLSRSKLYELWAVGAGPRKMQIGSKVLISLEAAMDWSRSVEGASAPDRHRAARRDLSRTALRQLEQDECPDIAENRKMVDDDQRTQD